ncbi:unnamed protein product [Eruca vesicaria subsp. sativa]|uniref:GRF-type domain-containing protein n=1 Tax=Eruca vesicaria subsp. sativa TaxID=29727 RepID=A0ABC8JUU2_ERUVS|nr:unnamed protein product [Eruca vesicaria subsp. sativa]CAH8336186.1 unnamed protein product [Eruca vesicaria subsp. sativa]
MAHSASSSTMGYKNEKGVLCNCKTLARVVQAWTDDNPGRRFYSCKGRKVEQGYESCNFFQWYDVERPYGWQHQALLEARDIMRAQKEEIKQLKESMRGLTHDRERQLEIPNSVLEELKASREECEGLKREALVLSERSRVYRNVLISSTFGFVVVTGVMVAMVKH